jgi:hypothetical protein
MKVFFTIKSVESILKSEAIGFRNWNSAIDQINKKEATICLGIIGLFKVALFFVQKIRNAIKVRFCQFNWIGAVGIDLLIGTTELFLLIDNWRRTTRSKGFVFCWVSFIKRR